MQASLTDTEILNQPGRSCGLLSHHEYCGMYSLLDITFLRNIDRSSIEKAGYGLVSLPVLQFDRNPSKLVPNWFDLTPKN